MKYRVHVCLAFEDKALAASLLEVLKKDFLPKAVSINEDKIIKETSSCFVEECHHDEIPLKPCLVLEKWEVKLGIPVNTVAAKVR